MAREKINTVELPPRVLSCLIWVLFVKFVKSCQHLLPFHQTLVLFSDRGVAELSSATFSNDHIATQYNTTHPKSYSIGGNMEQIIVWFGLDEWGFPKHCLKKSDFEQILATVFRTNE
jgi:hypothetical protein